MDSERIRTSISAGRDIYSILNADDEIRNCVTRIFPVVIPGSDVTAPFIVYRVVGTETHPIKGHISKDIVNVEISCVSRDYFEVVDLGESVRRAMNKPLKPDSQGLSIVRYTGRDEYWEEGTYVERLQFTLIYN